MRPVRFLPCVAALAVLLAGGGARAGGMFNFHAGAFAAAREKGTPVLVEIYAGWCHICWMQAPIVKGIVEKPEFAAVTVFVVDFDNQKDAVRRFGAQKQSTLIAFGRDGKEAGRLVGEVRPAEIEALLRKALPPRASSAGSGQGTE